MKLSFTTLFFLFPFIYGFAQTPRFVNPVEGVYGEDYIIVNYVDWEFQGILDHECGSKSYDGHQGTDYTLKSFPQMDSGFAVLAVDTGIVIATHDGEFDRETVSDPSKGLGNYIGLKHSGDLFTYYGHLRKNSLLVEIGDMVLPGQKIAEIASSGNSTDPHLHFELWYDSLFLIDPYAGDCGNPETYWFEPIPYDDSYGLWEAGLINFTPTLDELRERPIESTEFFIGTDSVISFWTLQYGLLEGDMSQIEWFTPDGDLWFSWDLSYDQDWWYHYFWSYIDMPPAGLEGNWKAVYSVNGQIEKELDFKVSIPSNIAKNNPSDEILFYSNGNIYAHSHHIFDNKNVVKIYDTLGRELVSKNLTQQNNSTFSVDFLNSGIYIAAITDGGAFRKTIKFMVD